MIKCSTIYHRINFAENLAKRINFYFIIEQLLKEDFIGE